jgi:predicted protein tyrosine phosphatase
MNIITLSRAEARNSIPRESGCYMISITEPDELPPPLHSDWKDILHIKCDDIDKESGSIPIIRNGIIVSHRQLLLFTKEQARDILDFVEKYKDSIDILAIHCHAGISRSVGARIALEKIYNTKDLYSKYPCHNRHVTSTILGVHREEEKDAITE